MTVLPPFPLENTWPSWFDGPSEPGTAPVTSATSLYLDVAECVVDTALEHWWDGDGRIRDPFEKGDRTNTPGCRRC